MPQWLKIFLILIGLMILGPMLVPLKELLLPAVLVFFLFFPGPDAKKPRLVKLAPYLWLLSFFSALVLFVLKVLMKTTLPEEVESVSTVEIIYAIISSPILLLLFLKEHRLFKPVLIVTYIGFFVVSLYNLIVVDRAVLDFIGSVATESILTIYLLKKLRFEQIN